MERKLNLDISGSVASFEILMKKVLPKNIFYKIIYGKGFEFDGYRDFGSDEDSANIDWKASIRSGKILSKKYIEERDLKILFLIDVSDNMIFGSTKKLKCEYSAELICALAHLILINGDRVSVILYNDKIVKQLPYGFGEKQFDLIRSEIENPSNYGGNSNLGKILNNFLESIDKSTSMIFVVSDFIKVQDNLTKKSLETLGKLFETVGLIVRDPLDFSLPDLSKEVILEDPYTHEKLFVNPSVAKYAYETNAKKQFDELVKLFNNCFIDYTLFKTDIHFALSLAEFLKIRSERRVYHTNNVS